MMGTINYCKVAAILTLLCTVAHTQGKSVTIFSHALNMAR